MRRTVATMASLIVLVPSALWLTPSSALSRSTGKPDCSNPRVNPGHMLWPPDHKFRRLTFGIRDGDTVAIRVVSVTQDEPVDGHGDGNTTPDARRAPRSDQILVRSERSSFGDGRVYKVTFAASAKSGQCEGSAYVGIPKNRKKDRTAVDSGQLFDSFGSGPA